jgi:TonB family protein
VRTDSSRAVSASPAPAVAIGRSEKRAPVAVADDAVPSEVAVPNDIGAVSVPTIAGTNVDSIVGASTKAARESNGEQIVTTGGLGPATTGDDDATARPPVLIGPAPLPRFPDALRSQRTDGEVVVRFRVDERGLIDGSSLKVVKSDHPLFTAAVRRELPRFRFQPARSPAPESKPRADWVDFRVEFTTKN